MAAKKKQEEERISQDIAGASAQYAGNSGYRPHDVSGNDYAAMAGMSDLDRAALEAAGQSYNQAQAAGDQAGMDAAHRQAESIRNQYGYSGGSDGSQYIPSGTPSREFSYESAPEYVSRYQSQIDDLTQEILHREPFQYNYQEDPVYQQYAQSYTRAGQRAMQDVLAQVSARTGGLASSYASTASQQTYDNYMQALADKVPELYQLAYSMYQDEGNQLRANLEMLTALESGDYGRYQDLLAQYNSDRNFSYGQYRDLVGDDRYGLEWRYGVGRDQIADQRYEDETAYNREQDAWNRQQYEDETEYNRALERAQTLAQAGDFSGYRALGYSDSEIASLQNAYNRALAAQTLSRSGGSSRRSSGSSSSSKPRLTYAQAVQAIEDGRVTDAVISAYDYYMGEGAYEAAYGGGGDEDGPTVDMNSVLQLGYGPVSENYLAELEADGKIESYIEGNKIKFRKVNQSNNTGFGGITLPSLLS